MSKKKRRMSKLKLLRAVVAIRKESSFAERQMLLALLQRIVSGF